MPTKRFILLAALLVSSAGALGAFAAEQIDSAQAQGAKEKQKRFLNPPKAADKWWMREGKGYALCEALYKELQQYTPNELGRCIAAVALSLPGMTEVDGWVELDPRAHGELFKRLQQYKRVGVDAYFRKTPRHAHYFEQKMHDDTWLERQYQGFIKHGVRMRVNTLPAFNRSLGDLSVAYEQPQTVLEIRQKARYGPCTAALLEPLESVETFYVTPDLSGPSPDIRAYEANAAKSGRLIEYKGVLHLMYTFVHSVSFYRDFGDGALRPFCEIQSVTSEAGTER